MQHSLDDSIAILRATPPTLDALLRHLPQSWTNATEGDGTWTPREIVGHLIWADMTDWLPRAQMILDHGESKPFDPFDREGQQSLIADRSLPSLLDEFHQRRASSVRGLQNLQLSGEQLALRGNHPTLGAVTLDQLLATWAVHDLTHIHQLSRVLAHQYRDAVGPWSAYLGVLHCEGHGG